MTDRNQCDAQQLARNLPPITGRPSRPEHLQVHSEVWHEGALPKHMRSLKCSEAKLRFAIREEQCRVGHRFVEGLHPS
jgi:hypothetical protein